MGNLIWNVQFASWGDPKDGLLHFANTPAGTFEIYDYEGNYLLHFPKRAKLPAELFDSLDAAKGRAALESNDVR